MICQASGDLGRAEGYFLQCLEIIERAYGKKHPHYRTAVDNLAHVCWKSMQFEKAATFYRQELDALKSVGQSTRRGQAICLNFLGLVYDDAGNFAKAEDSYRQSLAIFAELKADRDPLCILVTSNLALLYKNHGDFEQALGYSRRVLAARKAAFGIKSSEYRKSLETLSDTLTSAAAANEDRSKLAVARQQRQEALTVLEQGFSQNAWQVVDARLALAYNERLEKLSAEQRTRLVQSDDLMRQATEAEEQGIFRDAAAIAEKAVVIRSEILGDDRLTADSLYWQGPILRRVGEHARAKSATSRAEAIYGRLLGQQHPRYQSVLGRLAELERATKEYPKAIAVYRQLVRLQKRSGGRDYRRSAGLLAATLEDLEAEQVKKRDFASAKKSLDEALQIRLSVESEKDWKAAWTRLLIADLEKMQKLDRPQLARLDNAGQLAQQAIELNRQGRSRQALPLAREAFESRQTILGERHFRSLESELTLEVVLMDAGEMADSERVRNRLLPIAKSVYGENHPEYAKCLRSAAALNDAMGQHLKAEPLYRQAISIFQQTYGAGNATYAATLNDLAINCGNRGDHVQEEVLLEKAVAAHLRAEGAYDPNYAVSLKNLAVVYSIRGDRLRAERLLAKAADILRKSVGEKDAKYVSALRALAHLFADQRADSKAAELYGQALDITRSISGKPDLEFAAIEGELANLYRQKGEYQRARALATEALQTTRSILGERHPQYAECQVTLGWIETALNHFSEAEALEQSAADVFGTAYGTKHPRYASALKSLGQVFYVKEEYAQAEPLFRQALEIVAKSLGERHPEYANLLQEAAPVYLWMGDSDRALAMSLQAVQIDRQVFGENNVNYAIKLASLGQIHERINNDSRAREFFERALQIRTPIEGAASPTLHVLLENLGHVYMSQGFYEAAGKYFARVVEIRRKTVGEKHPDFALANFFLAETHFERGEFAESEKLFRQCLTIYQSAFGDHNSHSANCRYWLAKIAMQKGLRQEAARLAQTCLKAHLQKIDQMAPVQSERMQLAGVAHVRPYVDLVLSLANESREGIASVYDLMLACKGTVSGRQHEMRRLGRQIRLSGNAELAGLYDSLVTATTNLASLARSNPDPDEPGRLARQLEEASRLVDQLETSLSEKSALFRDRRLQHRSTAKEIQSSLPPGAVLLDLYYYLNFDPQKHFAKRDATHRTSSDEFHIVAFVLHAGRPEIECIDLGLGRPIVQAIEAWRAKFGRATTELTDPAQTLKKLVWNPLAAACKEAKLILISPDGDLARLPWNALPGDRPGTFLIEDAAIGIVPIPAQIPAVLANAAPPATSSTLMLVGDVRFDGLPGASGDREESRSAPRGTRSGSMLHWSELPGTVAEDTAIKNTFRQRFPTATVVELTRDDATEKAVRRDAPRSQFLHFATHGYFAPKELQSALAAASETPNAEPGGFFVANDVAGFHPGLLSGLVLAGANRPVDVDHDDGILTALEVEALDLGGVELATLSACETGLGTMKYGEGLLGLQRAFQTAGARSVVAGLWKVPDRATQALMERFYQNLWQKKLPKLEALREAQLWMIHEGPKQPGLTRGLDLADEPAETGNRLSPFYWAAFVLSGDWR